MDAIQAARELGKAIQADSRYIRVMEAQRKNDSDAELQKMIERFNAIRGELNQEITKENKDTEIIKELDTELKALYQEIFENDSMREFNEARNEFQSMIAFVNQIVSGSAGGENPDTIDMQEGGCAGDCGGCSGCS